MPQLWKSELVHSHINGAKIIGSVSKLAGACKIDARISRSVQGVALIYNLFKIHLCMSLNGQHLLPSSEAFQQLKEMKFREMNDGRRRKMLEEVGLGTVA